ncbi:MAG: DUF86 domain-containing protein [Dethiobacter sp.]|nr:DUF86 domain-containing protein [Dethiobacter sp.]
MVKKDLVLQKLKDLDRYLGQLRKHKGANARELEEDLEKLWIIERGLQICIQIVLDIGNHILAEKGLSVDSYKDILQELGKQNIIPQEFVQKISGMAGLRNILVHEYAKVDAVLLAGILNEGLDDFKQFAEYVIAAID